MILVQKLKTLITAAFLSLLFFGFLANSASPPSAAAPPENKAPSAPNAAPTSTPASAEDSVSIIKDPVQVEEKTFDHAAPGPEVPIKGREAATTHANFNYNVDIGCQAESSKRTGDLYVGTFKVTRVQAHLSLPITLWLPDTVNKRLREHEDGHRQIYEEIYGGADKTAKKQAESMIGETFIGQGKTMEEAREVAKRNAGIELNKRYCAEILVYAKLVSQLYDNATRSGTNKTPVFLAIRESFLQAWFMNLTRKH